MIFQTMKDDIIRAGFESVEEEKFEWPVGSWPEDEKLKEIGQLSKAHLDLGLEGWTLRAFTTSLGWSPERVTLYCVEMRKDMENPKIHGIQPMTTVFGRKPAA